MKYYAQIINENGNIAVDDTILVKDVECCAGSHILDGYKPLFSAEAVDRLTKNGYTIKGKTNVGEFSLDLVGEFSYHNEYKNDEPLKGASAQAVKDGDVKAALCVDMNGSALRAAALSDVSFLKPTYGTVSRYGVVSCAASGEQIGVMAKASDTIAQILSTIAGHDDKDGTSLRQDSYSYTTDADVKSVCVVKELLDLADDDTKNKVNAFADTLKSQGVTVDEISLDFFDYANTAWQILMCAETCNNVSRYDGVKFGHRSENYKNIDELYVNSRTEGFNFLTKTVILYGSDTLSKTRYNDCYDKALRIRRIVKDKTEELFAKYDCVLTPCCMHQEYMPYDIEDAFVKVFNESIFTAVPHLVGIPALSTNGVQLMSNHFDESKLLTLAKLIKKEGE